MNMKPEGSSRPQLFAPPKAQAHYLSPDTPLTAHDDRQSDYTIPPQPHRTRGTYLRRKLNASHMAPAVQTGCKVGAKTPGYKPWVTARGACTVAHYVILPPARAQTPGAETRPVPFREDTIIPNSSKAFTTGGVVGTVKPLYEYRTGHLYNKKQESWSRLDFGCGLNRRPPKCSNLEHLGRKTDVVIEKKFKQPNAVGGYYCTPNKGAAKQRSLGRSK